MEHFFEYVMIVNVFISIISLIYLKYFYKKNESKNKLRSLFINIILISIVIFFAVFTTKLISSSGDTTTKKEISKDKNEDILNLKNLISYLPNKDYTFVEKKFADYEELEIVRRNGDTIQSIIKIFKLSLDVNSTFVEQTDKIFNDVLKSNTNETFYDIQDKKILDDMNVYSKEFKFKFLDSNNGIGNLYSLKKGDKIIIISVSIFNVTYKDEISKLIKTFIEKI